jgi:tetratricopeptide (TPR) repeat protein
VSLTKSDFEWLRAIRVSLAIFVSWNLAGCATVSQQQLQEASLSQVSLPSMKAKAKKALDAGQFVEAARWYELAIERTDDEGLVREATVSAYEHAQWRSAVRCANRWLAINPTSQEGHEIAAFSAVRLYQVDVATEHLDALLASAFISPASGFLQLLPKVQALDASAALATMQNLAQKYPQIAEAHYVVAKLAAQTANQALMLSEAQRAHELSPYWAPAGLTLAHAQLAGDQVDQALATAKSVIVNDRSIATRSEYAAILLEAGRINEAIALLKELEKSPDDVGPALLLLAQIELQSGEFQAAFDHYSRLMSGSSRASEAVYGMAQISERAGILDSARQLYARVQEGEFALPAQIRLAQIIQKQDGLDAALASLKQYGDGNPDKFLEILRAQAELLLANGNNKEAMELYDQSIANYPDEASLKLARAFLLIKLDKIDAALASMKLLMNERPEDPIVLNALGYTMVDRTRDVHQGYALIQHAMQYSPDSGAVLDSMGWAEFKMGHAASALTYIQRASTRTIDADLDLHLGEVLWSMKRFDEAVAAWRVGLTHSPKHPQLLQRIQMAEKQHKGSANTPPPPDK